jgi:hypothetical protein
MNPSANVEDLGNHEYLLRAGQDDDTVEVVIRADPDGAIGGLAEGATESAMITAAVEFLLTRQRPDELPPYLDLDDIAAGYADFPGFVRDQLDRAAAAGPVSGAGSGPADETASEDLRRLLRWQDAGGTWRVDARALGSVTVSLCRCDGGEEVDWYSSTDRQLLAFLNGRESSQD